MNKNLLKLAKEHCDGKVGDVVIENVPDGMVENIWKIRGMLEDMKKDLSQIGENDRLKGIDGLIDASYDAEGDFKLYCKWLRMASEERYFASKRTGKQYRERWDIW